MWGVRARSDSPIIRHLTHEGVRGKRNDDRCAYFFVADALGGVYCVLVVADGVTSSEGSAQASEIAVREIKHYLTTQTCNGSPVSWIKEAVYRAHGKILQVSSIYPEWRSMCTTLVLAVVHQDLLFVAHMGDSRAYLIRQRSIHLLTKDHTWTQDAVDRGHITEQEAKSHPKRHIVKKFLGIQERIALDCLMIDPASSESEQKKHKMVSSVNLLPGDAILLCTDGLTEKIEDWEVGEVVLRAGSRVQKAVHRLVRLALKRKEADNITVLLMRMPEANLSYFHRLSRQLKTMFM